jgi:hypothetical protein
MTSTPERRFYEQLMAATIRANALLTACWRRRSPMQASTSCLEAIMFSQFEEVMRHHPAALMGYAGRQESSLAVFERLERKPFRPSPPPMRQRDRLSFGGSLTMIIAFFAVLAAVLAL